jgi:hypothetical protein
MILVVNGLILLWQLISLFIFFQYWDALKLCSEQNVVVTEDLAEKLTPQKANAGPENDERKMVLLKSACSRDSIIWRLRNIHRLETNYR